MPALFDPKHETFCRQYLEHGNATKAAIEAGYSESSASTQGHRMLNNDEILARIEELRSSLAERHNITEDIWMSHLKAIAFQNLDDFTSYDEDGKPYLDLQKATSLQRSAIQKLKIDYTGKTTRVDVSFHPKLPALTKLAEKMGYQKEEPDAAYAGKQRLFEGLRTLANTPVPPGYEIGLLEQEPFASPAEYFEHMAKKFRREEGED